jgi:branched-chain amino acid transport system permease protein
VSRNQKIALWLLVGGPIAVFSLWAMLDNTRLYVVTMLNGLTLGSLYFIVASGFTLVFGLMRNVNLAHGSLYLLGGYVGFVVAEKTGLWLLAIAAGFGSAALAGLLIQLLILRHMQGQDLRQTMVTIGLSIVIADLLIWIFTGQVHQMEAPEWLQGPVRGLPIINAYSAYRLSLLGMGILIGVGLWLLLNRTRVGMMIRAGVDDRAMLSAAGVNVNLVFAITFALGAGLAGLGGVVGAVELSMVPGEDTRLLLASLIVVIVRGHGQRRRRRPSAPPSSAWPRPTAWPTPHLQRLVFVFLILIRVLAFRPRGIMGKAHEAHGPASWYPRRASCRGALP